MPEPNPIHSEITGTIVPSRGKGLDSAFLVALTAATLLHLGAIMLVSFEARMPDDGALPESAMEILILRESGRDTAAPTLDAALSQRDRQGTSPAGDAVHDDAIPEVAETVETNASPPLPTETPVEPAADTPLETRSRNETALLSDALTPIPEPDPVEQRADPAREPPGMPARTPADEPPLDLAEIPSVGTTPEPEARPEPEPEPTIAPPKTIDAARILASRSDEIDRLTANLQAKTAAYASRVRRKSVSASTREFRYASYLGAWARKVERIGNLNYPQAARDQRMFGSLILHVAVRSDGSVEQIRIVRSSGYDLLDEAAVRIVELAAPYAPFPPDIAAETDVLDIVRTWQFLRGGGLGWEQ
jgi:periplasmic protein TonB